MNNFNKCFLVFLMLSAICLNSMEEKDHSSEPRTEETLKKYSKPFSYKAHCSLKVLELIRAGQLE